MAGGGLRRRHPVDRRNWTGRGAAVPCSTGPVPAGTAPALDLRHRRPPRPCL